MASSATESTPLLPQHAGQLQSQNSKSIKPRRTVTFDSHVAANEARDVSPRQSTSALTTVQSAPSVPNPPGEAASVISTLNNKLRRRNSQGTPQAFPNIPAPKIGPQRTTKVAEKLKILPSPEQGEEDEESGRDVYSQFTRIKDPTARRDAARLGKEDRKRLPRVTAYCTAGSYRMTELMRYLKGRIRDRGAQPKLFDECIYTTYTYGKPKNAPIQEPPEPQRRYSDSIVEVGDDQLRNSLIDLREHGSELDSRNGNDYFPGHMTDFSPEQLVDHRPDIPAQDFDIEVHTPEIFLFSYGTVVIWGMTLQQEHKFLKEIAKFEIEKLAKDDVQTEDFNFYYTREYQARIYNDFISLMDKKNYMTKLAISHALSQSVKVRSVSQWENRLLIRFANVVSRLHYTRTW
jgi:uncharacterized Rmd1/YagE family protein